MSKMIECRRRAFRALIASGTLAMLCTAPARAFDGWHQESATTVPGPGSAWDYLALDGAAKHLFIGHRKEGLQVYDTAQRKVVKVIAGTPAASSNGAVLIPEFDLGVSNNEDGTIIPFSLTTLEARPPIKLGEELDTSHYEPVSKRILVNMAPGKEGTELAVLAVPSLEKVGVVSIKSVKPEHAIDDGTGHLFLAARDLSVVYKVDMRLMKVVAEWPAPGCGQANSIAYDAAGNRLFVACRGSDKFKPSLTVMDSETGRGVYTAEIGGGNDGLVYDPQRKRIFLANGVTATLNVFEQVDADTYRPLEALGTRSGVRSLTYDPGAQRLYSVGAEGTADHAKKIVTTVSPFYANTFFPDSFSVITYVRQ